ncbi:lactoylglutathione lyase [Agarivorans aestuarii]|uniref:Aldoketomutase n=1 Tax=Agarivorans aestuarii TaxID=1563703 RepID=A0ABU7G0A0_9ALTE|nr:MULTISPECIES: lactoylglutathione lyase [Agarivorans]MEE1672594.1 lactoylglutathione lyase [Agarivorans aestuarii]
MKFLHTMVRVKDLDESMRFYCDLLGMSEVRRYESEQGRFSLIYLAADEDIERVKAENAPCLELTYNWPDEDGQQESYSGGRNFGHIAVSVEDIYGLCQKLQDAGVTINRPPRDGHMAFVVSPDGISVELLQQGESLAPQEPWASMPSTGSW